MTAWTQLKGPVPAILFLVLLSLIQEGLTAPYESEHSTEIEYYPVADATGCYYNFEHYDEGDRIITNEPCLNCTCHNRMLMCYLRVCPFTKAIGQDCKVEKKADQCCPVITCPEVPVHLVTHSPEQATTALGHLNEYGCSIDGLFYADGAKVPSSPNNPCEVCYCIRNKTACIIQDCTLRGEVVEGCEPVYVEGVCCPLRYDCDHPQIETTPRPLLTTTTTTTTTTTLAPTMAPTDCIYNNEVYPDGTLLKKDIPCEKCYCMKGDIVCAVQECGPTPLDKVNCTALPVKEGQCCPDTYDCGQLSEEDLTTISSYDVTTVQPSVTTYKEGAIVFPQDEDETNKFTEHPTKESTEKEKMPIDHDAEERQKITTESFTESVTEAVTSRVTEIISAVTTALYGSSEPSQDKQSEASTTTHENEDQGTTSKKSTEVPVPEMDEGSGAEPITEVPEAPTSTVASETEKNTPKGSEGISESAGILTEQVPQTTSSHDTENVEETESPIITTERSLVHETTQFVLTETIDENSQSSSSEPTIVTEPEKELSVPEQSPATEKLPPSKEEESTEASSTGKSEVTEANVAEEPSVTTEYPVSEGSSVTDVPTTDESPVSKSSTATEVLPEISGPQETERPAVTEAPGIKEGPAKTEVISETERPSITQSPSFTEEKCTGDDCQTATEATPHTEQTEPPIHDCQGSECEHHQEITPTFDAEDEKTSIKPGRDELTTRSSLIEEQPTVKPDSELTKDIATTESEIEIITSAPTKDTEKPPSMDHVSENIPPQNEPEIDSTEKPTVITGKTPVEEITTISGDVQSNEIPVVHEKCTEKECPLLEHEPGAQQITPEPEEPLGPIAHDCDEDDEECTSHVETPSEESTDDGVPQTCEDGKECSPSVETQKTDSTTVKSIETMTLPVSQPSEKTTGNDIRTGETEPSSVTTASEVVGEKEVVTQKSGEEKKEPIVTEKAVEEVQETEPEIFVSTTESGIEVTEGGVKSSETPMEPLVHETPMEPTEEPEPTMNATSEKEVYQEVTSQPTSLPELSEVSKHEYEDESTKEIYTTPSSLDKSHTEHFDTETTQTEGGKTSTHQPQVEKDESITEQISELATTQKEEEHITSVESNKEITPELTTIRISEHVQSETTTPEEKESGITKIPSGSSTSNTEDSEATTVPSKNESEITEITEIPSGSSTSNTEESEATTLPSKKESVELYTTLSSVPSAVSEAETISPASESHTTQPEEITTREYGIPGEGSCLVDGQTYKNNSNVPPVNQCQVACTCVSSILQCQSVPCEGSPENMQNCIPIFHSPDSCCPTYSCSTPGVTSMESDSHTVETTTAEKPVDGGEGVTTKPSDVSEETTSVTFETNPVVEEVTTKKPDVEDITSQPIETPTRSSEEDKVKATPGVSDEGTTEPHQVSTSSISTPSESENEIKEPEITSSDCSDQGCALPNQPTKTDCEPQGCDKDSSSVVTGTPECGKEGCVPATNEPGLSDCGPSGCIPEESSERPIVPSEHHESQYTIAPELPDETTEHDEGEHIGAPGETPEHGGGDEAEAPPSEHDEGQHTTAPELPEETTTHDEGQHIEAPGETPEHGEGDDAEAPPSEHDEGQHTTASELPEETTTHDGGEHIGAPEETPEHDEGEEAEAPEDKPEHDDDQHTEEPDEILEHAKDQHTEAPPDTVEHHEGQHTEAKPLPQEIPEVTSVTPLENEGTYQPEEETEKPSEGTIEVTESTDEEKKIQTLPTNVPAENEVAEEPVGTDEINETKQPLEGETVTEGIPDEQHTSPVLPSEETMVTLSNKSEPEITTTSLDEHVTGLPTTSEKYTDLNEIVTGTAGPNVPVTIESFDQVKTDLQGAATTQKITDELITTMNVKEPIAHEYAETSSPEIPKETLTEIPKQTEHQQPVSESVPASSKTPSVTVPTDVTEKSIEPVATDINKQSEEEETTSAGLPSSETELSGSESSSETEAPIVTEQPKISYTTKHSESSQTTESGTVTEGSGKPNETESPSLNEIPVGTEASIETVFPVETDSAITSGAPEITELPVEINKPIEDISYGETTKSSQTVESAESVTMASASSPGQSEEPNEITGPIQTEASTKTGLDNQTETSSQTEEPLKTIRPHEVETPHETEVPQETEAPSYVAETPNKTEAPHVTEISHETETSHETEIPQGTEPPSNATEKPYEEGAQHDTEAPNETETSHETKLPQETEAPSVVTEGSHKTEEPHETEAPHATETSHETEVSQETEPLPNVTEDSIDTEAPHETEPKGTEASVKSETKAPQQTNVPFAASDETESHKTTQSQELDEPTEGPVQETESPVKSGTPGIPGESLDNELPITTNEIPIQTESSGSIEAQKETEGPKLSEISPSTTAIPTETETPKVIVQPEEAVTEQPKETEGVTKVASEVTTSPQSSVIKEQTKETDLPYEPSPGVETTSSQSEFSPGTKTQGEMQTVHPSESEESHTTLGEPEPTVGEFPTHADNGTKLEITTLPSKEQSVDFTTIRMPDEKEKQTEVTAAPPNPESTPLQNMSEPYTSGPKLTVTDKPSVAGELSTSLPVTTEPSTLLTSPHVSDSHPEIPDIEDYSDYTEQDENPLGPGTCRYGGKVYVSAQQIPREDPCDFCFCFRSDIICLQQSCPPPIPNCHEEPIKGFCCPRYQCPVNMATSLNLTTSTTTTTTTLPPHFFSHAYKGRATRNGCQLQGRAYNVGEMIKSASGPCMHCICGGDGQMKCDPKPCSPEPMLRQMIAAVTSRRR